MPKIAIPYGRSYQELCLPNSRAYTLLESEINRIEVTESPEEIVGAALASPYGSTSLSELAIGKKRVVIIASDHTRPVPSRVIIPQMLSEIRKGNPSAEITLLIATGAHRSTTKAELIEKFGEAIVASEKIVIHDCLDESMLADIGTLPSGGRCRINRLAAEADLLVSEGFVEPHFFAGFSGGRKSVLPGISSRETVLANHCSEFINSPFARTGILESNPIHRDMVWAAKQAGLAFIVNVVINSEKRVMFAVSSEPSAAHSAACKYLSGLCRVKAAPADIVITGNSGYPLDANIYQAVKGMTAAEATVNPGGVIIMLAEASDGVGGAHFFSQLADEPDIDKTLSIFLSRSGSETVPDQWQTQILLRILKRAKVILVSSLPDETVKCLHMIPAATVNEALALAESLLGKTDATLTIIPDGVSVIVTPNTLSETKRKDKRK